MKASEQLHIWFEDDDALERTINGEWNLLPCGDDTRLLKPICLSQDETNPCIIGSVRQQEDYAGNLVTVPLPRVSQFHAQINYKDEQNQPKKKNYKDEAFFLTDLSSQHGTWITKYFSNEGRRYKLRPNYPSRVRPSDVIEFGFISHKSDKICSKSVSKGRDADFTENIKPIKFDTFTPAAERGSSVTRVISRMTLQEILACAVGEDAIWNASNVVDFVDDGPKVVKLLKKDFMMKILQNLENPPNRRPI
ncbi:zeaxanthin epoxidase chloroplastic-like [Trifolium medium]|uniref:Zeaxanthin epoxidase chloroplastic-like n=1 Tax=Trifolium medium TaxID=97028 RepID=A0A392M0Y1_9FABA|nr:zeaxanthin epoxidase chloroplastic-like [Trifolium medium]